MHSEYKLSKMERQEEEWRFVLSNLTDELIDKGYKKVGVTTSTKSRIFTEALLENLNNENFELKEIKPVAIFSDSIKQAKQCDAVILVERYGFTVHNMFERTINMLRENEVKIVGVIAFKA
ncbi:hypothetical protein DWW31_08550 [Clostridium sp. AF15-17LB]|nr:hypothetical protein DWW31_08550 [Clostridium sp. AF15-17LB]